MKDSVGDPIYWLIDEFHQRGCHVDYSLALCEEPYEGLASHRQALALMVEKWQSKYECPSEIEKARAWEISAETLLSVPDTPWKHETEFGCSYEDVSVEGRIPYWYAFLEPPYGTGEVKRIHKVFKLVNPLVPDDFHALNRELFPNGAEELEIYEWSTDWSSYFDEGNEWWGCCCFTVYDKSMNRFVVITASTTD